MIIVKAKIGNALTSTAADHVVAVTADLYDEALEKYQSVINSECVVKLKELSERIDSMSGSSEGVFEVVVVTQEV